MVVLRTGIVLDRGAPAFERLTRLTKLGLGGRISRGDQWVSWIHVDDFLRALRFVCDEPAVDGVVHVTSANPIQNRDMMATLRAALTGRGRHRHRSRSFASVPADANGPRAPPSPAAAASRAACSKPASRSRTHPSTTHSRICSVQSLARRVMAHLPAHSEGKWSTTSEVGLAQSSKMSK